KQEFGVELRKFKQIIPRYKPERKKLELQAIKLIKSKKKKFSVNTVLSVLEEAYGELEKRKELIRKETTYLLKK
ncbi:unnamed protein product, partial [marine sediment metagenome]